jgi:hypothetical protein
MSKFPVYKSERLHVRGNKLVAYDRGREVAALIATFLKYPEKFPLQHRCIMSEELAYSSGSADIKLRYYFDSVALLPIALALVLRHWRNIENGVVEVFFLEDNLNSLATKAGFELIDDWFVEEARSHLLRYRFKEPSATLIKGQTLIGFFGADSCELVLDIIKRYQKHPLRLFILDHSNFESKSIADKLRLQGIRIFESPLGYGIVHKL